MNEAMTQIVDFFSYDFARQAIMVGASVSLCASLLGVSLVLKRYSMIGDGLSHVGFAVLALSAAFGATGAGLVVSLPAVAICAVLLLRITEKSRVGGDAAIAVLSTLSLAAGYIAMYNAGTNVDINSYMFGSMFTIRKDEAIFCIVTAAVVTVLFILFYHRIFAITYDESFAASEGIPVGLYNTVLAVLTAVTIVLGMKMMGTLLISALIIFPALTSMRVFGSFRAVTVSSAIVSLTCFFAGTISAHVLSIPAGSSVVAANGIAFAVFTAVGALVKKK